jgi:transcriptional regulator with XRE-family HTH domain
MKHSNEASEHLENDFAPRLKSLRRQAGLSQEELAKRVGVHTTHIGRYERGNSRPSADALARLADALGVSGDYLLAGVEESAARARLQDRDLLRQFQEAEKLPEEDKNIIKKLIEAFLMKKKITELAVRL